MLFAVVISLNSCYGQVRFFNFSEGWQTQKVIERDSSFLSIGLGYTGSYQNYLQFEKINKQGAVLEDWIFKLDSTNTTEFTSEQAVSTDDFGNSVIAGTITYAPAALTSIAARLQFSENFTTYSNSWIYTPCNNSPAQFRISIFLNNGQIINSAACNYSGSIRSMILQTDLSGNLEWEKQFSCSGYCDMEPRHIIPAHDNGYLFTNEEKRRVVPGGGPGDHNVATIIKVDSFGNQEWRIYPGGTGFPYTSDYILVTPTDDGNYLCAWADNNMRVGSTNIAYYTNPDVTIWFAKINEQGQKLWEKNIQPDIEMWGIGEIRYRLTQMKKIADGNIVLVGLDKMIKITQDADVIWARNLKPDFLQNPSDPESYLYIKGLTPTTDDGFICAGQANIYPGSVFPQFTQTGFVIKLDEYGCLEPDCHLNDPVSTTTTSANHTALKLFPNPAQDYINIEYSTNKSPTFIAVNITDLAGRVIYAQVLENQEQYLTIPTKDLPPGQYFCQLFVDGSVGASRKFVVAR